MCETGGMYRWLFALLVGCGGGAVSPPDLAMPLDLAQPPPDMALPARIRVGATDGMVELKSSDFSLAGAGTNLIGAIAIDHGAGTIELMGKKVPAAVYERQGFPGLRLYQTLAVEPDRLWVLWFYCKDTDGTLTGAYYEATDGTMVTYEVGSGVCTDPLATSSVHAVFPAVDLALPPLIDGYTVKGPDVVIDGAQPGMVRFGQTTLAVLVFNTVDCTVGCGTPGWTELHALLWDPVKARVCFGIFYLQEDKPGQTLVTYSLTLPDLSDPVGRTTLAATWSLP
jgi:hypothetical protein